MRWALLAFAIGLFISLGTIAGVMYVLWHLPVWTFDSMRTAWRRPR